MYTGAIAGLLVGTPIQAFVIMLFKEYREEITATEKDAEYTPLPGEEQE